MQERPRIKDSEDGMLALAVLVAILVIVAVGGYYIYNNEKLWSKGRGSGLTRPVPFTPPEGRQAYFDAKEKVVFDDAGVENLKKLLMRRAMANIPTIFSLQHDGSAIERLYKKGMLTDDMHFRVGEIKTYVDAEIADVQAEADQLKEGWGEEIWPQAMKLYQLEMQKRQAQAQDEIAQRSPSNSPGPGAVPPSQQASNQGFQAASRMGMGGGSAPGTPAANSPVLSKEEQARKAEEMQKQLLEEDDRDRLAKGDSGLKRKKKKK